MATGIKVPPRSAHGNVGEWLKVAEYVVKLEDITSTFSTGEYTLARLPPNIYIDKIAYRCVVDFYATSDDVFPEIWFGDTVSPKKWGMLNAAQLGDSNAYGELPINYETTSTGGVDLVVDIGYQGIASTQGQVELWLHYRAYAASPVIGGRKAK